MKKFILDFLKPNSEVSSSRGFGLLAILGLLAMIVGNWLGVKFQVELIISLVAIVTGVAGFNTYDKIKNKLK